MRRPPRSTRTYPLFPDTTLFRSPDRGLDDRFAREELRARFRDLRLLHRRVARGQRRAADIGEQRQDRALADAVEEVLGCRPPPACDIDIHDRRQPVRSEEHTSELQSLMRNSYAVFCLKKKQIQY